MAYRTDPALVVTRGDSGDYAQFTITVTKDGNPVDVTGNTFYMTAKHSLSDTIPVFQCSTARGDFDMSDAATGVVLVELRPTDTAGVQQDTSLYCDIQMNDANGIVTIDKFMLAIEVDVTEVFA